MNLGVWAVFYSDLGKLSIKSPTWSPFRIIDQAIGLSRESQKRVKRKHFASIVMSSNTYSQGKSHPLMEHGAERRGGCADLRKVMSKTSEPTFNLQQLLCVLCSGLDNHPCRGPEKAPPMSPSSEADSWTSWLNSLSH